MHCEPSNFYHLSEFCASYFFQILVVDFFKVKFDYSSYLFFKIIYFIMIFINKSSLNIIYNFTYLN
jgi:hypothetical protein